MKKQQGFAVLEVLLVVGVVAVLGLTGWMYYQHVQQAATTPPTATANVPVAPQVNSAADLTTAENILDQVDVGANASDSSQLDVELNGF